MASTTGRARRSWPASTMVGRVPPTSTTARRDHRRLDRWAMDGTHLNIAADRLNELADEVEEFVTRASEKAAEVAQQVRDVAAELKAMASAVEGTHTGTVEPTPPEGEINVEQPPPDAEPTV